METVNEEQWSLNRLHHLCITEPGYLKIVLETDHPERSKLFPPTNPWHQNLVPVISVEGNEDEARVKGGDGSVCWGKPSAVLARCSWASEVYEDLKNLLP